MRDSSHVIFERLDFTHDHCDATITSLRTIATDKQITFADTVDLLSWCTTYNAIAYIESTRECHRQSSRLLRREDYHASGVTREQQTNLQTHWSARRRQLMTPMTPAAVASKHDSTMLSVTSENPLTIVAKAQMLVSVHSDGSQLFSSARRFEETMAQQIADQANKSTTQEVFRPRRAHLIVLLYQEVEAAASSLMTSLSTKGTSLLLPCR